MEIETFDSIGLLKKHTSLETLREALVADGDLCERILADCSEFVERIASFPGDTRVTVLFLVELMQSGECPWEKVSELDSPFWMGWAAPVFLFNEAGPALRQHRANRLETAFALPEALPEPRRGRF